MIRIAAACLLALTPAIVATSVSAQSAPNTPDAPVTTGHPQAHADFSSERIHVRVDGAQDLPDLVLIAGLSSSPAIWQETVDRLEDRYRIHRIHVHGFAGAPAGGNAQTGETPAPVIAPVAEEIARYIDEKGLDRPAVIGHSLGGTLGMMVAARHPQSVGRLMVVDMVPFVGAFYGAPGATVADVTPMADQLWAGQARISREQYIAAALATVSAMVDNDERREMALEHVRNSDQGVSAAAFRDLVVTDLRPELGNITAPITVLYVAFRDPAITEAVSDFIYRSSFANKADATLKRIDDSAHFIMFDQPEVFAREVEAFLSAN